MIDVDCVIGHAGHALGHVRVQWPAGCLVALTGANGSGKSTLLATISGEVEPLAGQVRTQARVVRISEPVFYPELSIGEHCRLLRRCQSPAEEEFMVARWRLAEILRVRPGQLSSGQRQRAYLATQLAVVQPHSVVAIDEPERHLDAQWTEELVRYLRELATNKGCCVVVATHHEQIIASCDVTSTMQDLVS